MLSDCSDLRQCEDRLSKETKNVSLLGQIEHSSQDLANLGTLVRHTIAQDISRGTCFIEQHAPTCLACLLVWTGIVGYRDGDYWSAVRESTGLVEDPNWEGKWGNAFLEFLKKRGLPRFEIKGGLTYVTPILAHGGIPNSCLIEFFEHLLLPMVERDLLDPTDSEEIVQELAFRREDDKERASVERRYRDSQGQTRTAAGKARLAGQVVDLYDRVVKLWGLEESLVDPGELANLPADYDAFREHKQADLHSLGKKIADREEKRTHYRRVVAGFSEQDKKVLDQAEVIESIISGHPLLEEQQQEADALVAKEGELASRLESQSTYVFSEPWNSEHGGVLSQLHFVELKDAIKRFETSASRQDAIRNTLDHLRTLSGAPFRVWSIPAFILLLGLSVVVMGVRILGSWLLTIVGCGITITAGLRGWSQYRQISQERRHNATLEQSLGEKAIEQSRILEEIAGIVSGLPILDQHLRLPSLRLYRELSSLADFYQEWRETRSRRVQLQQEARRQTQRIVQIAASVGVRPGDSPSNVIRLMEQALEYTRGRQMDATHATHELGKLQRTIKTLKAKRQTTNQDLIRVEERLKTLGGGDVQTGVIWVQEQRRLRDRAEKARERLGKEYPGLETVERAIRNAQINGRDKAALQAEAKQLAERLRGHRRRTGEWKHKLSFYPAAFPRVDEPIRRYLLYAGEPAKDFLIRSVLLAHRTLDDGKVPCADDIGLPGRVVRAFEHWWVEPEPPAEGEGPPVEPPNGQRFRMPAISLDPKMAEIVVSSQAQRYPASIAGTSAHLEVVGSNTDPRCQTVNLRVYRSTENLVETEECDFPLRFPAERYDFSLAGGSKVVCRWNVAAMCGKVPYMAFDWQSGKLVTDKNLPLAKGKVWFVVGKSFSLDPADCELESGSLFGEWKDYIFRALDLKDVDSLQIVDGHGQSCSIPVASEEAPDPGPVGGQLLEGVHSDGDSIYVGQPPRICVPIEDEAELRLWRLSILLDVDSRPQERRHFRLSEVPEALDIHAGKGWIDVLLTDERLLGQRPVGRFTVRVRKQPHTDWRYTFCAVPDLQIEFDRGVYLPHIEGETPKVTAMITVAEDAEFVPQPPANLLNATDNRYRVGIDGSGNTLRGTLCLRSEAKEDRRIPLAIIVPKVRWRLQGLEDAQHSMWCDTIEEVWLGDWQVGSELFLIVALPPFVDGRLNLALRNGLERDKEIQDGKVRFNLLAFGDVLRALPSVQTFTFSLVEPQFELENVPLFQARTHWEAVDAECIQRIQSGNILLDVEWTEKGRTGGKSRIARLWKMPGAGQEPTIEQAVLEGQQSVTLCRRAKDVPPGDYLLELALEDPWSTTAVSPPEWQALNTLPVKIVPVPATRQGEVIVVSHVADEHGRHYAIGEGLYKIRIFGKIVNRELPPGVEDDVPVFANEGWYVGDFELSGDMDVDAELAGANPVKFDYQRSEELITAIEDRCGDGAVFCRTCRRLFWSLRTIRTERARGHPLFGPVEMFRIEWE